MDLFVFGVDRPAGAGFPEEVPAEPGEVTDHVCVLGDQLPQVGDLGREGLRADDDAVGEGVLVDDVAAVAVVEADDVEDGRRFDEPVTDDV